MMNTCKICKICNKKDCISRKEYHLIVQAWVDNQSMSDIYDMIIVWINKHNNHNNHNNHNKDLLHLTDEIMKRAENDNSINEIVEDFIYGKNFEPLRMYYA